MKVFANGKITTGYLLETMYSQLSDSTIVKFAIDGTIEELGEAQLVLRNTDMSPIKKVIFNPPATIVLWGDGTKTVVKANGRCGHTVVATSYSDNGETKTEEIEIGELYDPEKGLAMCIAKKALGNKGNYYNEFKRWLDNDGNDKDTD